MLLYHYYELQRLSLEPARLAATSALSLLDLPFNPLRPTPFGRVAAAALDSFEHSTRVHRKPAFGLANTLIGNQAVPVTEEVVWSGAWCQLLRFRREAERPDDPRLLIVAPMSGHFATLLRGTVREFLPDHDVYITDWRDASMVPLSHGDFDLDDYIDLVSQFLHLLGPRTHVIGVCQPAVPVLAAISLLSADGDAAV